MAATTWLPRCLQVAVVVLVVAVEVPRCEAQGGGTSGVVGLVQVIVRKGLSDCHLAVVGYGPTVLQSILRGLDGGGASVLPRTVVDVAEAWQGRRGLLKGVVRGDVRAGCRMLVAQAAGRGKEQVFQFLEEARLYEWEKTYVVLVGGEDEQEEQEENEEEAKAEGKEGGERRGKKLAQEEALLHHTFRNTHFILYLAPRHSSPMHLTHPPPDLAATKGGSRDKQTDVLRDTPMTPATKKGGVRVYTRCLYCSAGRPSVRLLYIWEPSGTQQSSNFFPEPLRSLQGHRQRIVSMEWFPFIDYDRHTPEGGAVVTPRDSLDYRMLKEISKRLNFTYEMRAPWDNQWGTSTASSNWTGVVGTLQYRKADFSMMLSYMPTRLPVVHYSRIYASEPLVMVTSKPRPLSQASALVRPFSGDVWMLTMVSAVASGVVLWGMQKIWAWAAGCEGLELSKAMMTTWGILLEDPPLKMPSNITGQMLVGWWWVYCMLLTIVYRSSLIAHLTVPSKSPTLESLADLLEANRRERWTWGYEPTYGSGWEWLKINENPIVRTVFNSLILVGLDDQLARVFRGHHAFITWKYYIRSVVAARYKGASPLHTAREELFNYGGYGWGFRRGAPFRSLVDNLQGRLVESGLVTLWLDQLVDAGMTTRSTAPVTPSPDTQLEALVQAEGEARVVLGLGHLQGIFYLLGIGLALALATFLAELLPFGRREDTKKA